MADPLRCFLIGSDSLLNECGEILLTRGHRVLGVITDAPRVAVWAQERGLPVHDAAADYSSALAAEPFDYLFSITWLSLIPDAVLALPERGAVNFHDGPLPRYAGLNAPSWALMAGEEEYGITWHRISAGVDRGDILDQQLFPIADGETSLSLNTRCFQAALDSFGGVVDRLADGSAEGTAQDFSERSYFGRDRRPPAAGVLDWQRSAVELDCLVRALDYGRYWNPLGSAKILHGSVAVVPSRCSVDPEPREAPGTLLAIDESGVTIACAEGTLTVHEVRGLCGGDLGLTAWVERAGLKQGAVLDALSPEQAEALEAADSAARKREQAVAATLASRDEIDLPFLDASAQPSGRIEQLPVTLPEALAGSADESLAIAAFAAFLARVGDRDDFALPLRTPETVAAAAGSAPLFSAWEPLEIQVDVERSWQDWLQQLRPSLEELGKRGRWLHDLVGRHPDLQGRTDLLDGRLGAVTVQVVADADSLQPAALTLRVDRHDGSWSLCCDDGVLDADRRAALARRFDRFLAGLATQPDTPLRSQDLLAEDERRQVLQDWNATAVDYPRDACVHQLFEQQAQRTPDATALTFEGESLSYAALNRRADALAAHLRGLGVGPDVLVGVCVERSLDLMVAVLGVQKAGGAYVPLDPEYPRERLAFMVEDARMPVIILQQHLRGLVLDESDPERKHSAQLVEIDAPLPPAAEPVASEVRPEHLAYVIYTSGSTGKPKGVMVEHRNVVNFFAGMDQRIDHEKGGVWLAVTSLSFDISVLELFWTLARGFQVVIYRDRARQASLAAGGSDPKLARQPIDFSLFYFSSDAGDRVHNKYQLLLDGARFADAHGFSAVWTPERHFHEFGGLYPHPAVTGAAVAAVTQNVQIRAGSVVLPLHHPVRVAEAWSVVDNISGGRVGVSIAAGWQPNDFLLMPENFKEAKQIMFRDAEVVQKLWRGESVAFPGPLGEDVEVRTLPRPLQKELPMWVTAAGNIETFRMAGEIGANLLTHLLGQSVEELQPKIEAYRAARKDNGFDPDAGIVSLMLHSYVGDDDEEVKEIVREPLKQYLGSSLSLLKKYAWAFPAFAKPSNLEDQSGDEFSDLSEEEHDALLEHAFLRYYETSGLFGTPARCAEMVDRVKAIGVNEIACMIDFGIPVDLALGSLPALAGVRAAANAGVQSVVEETQDRSFAAQAKGLGVTHMQCTPSMARMLSMDEEAQPALAGIQHLMVGGEALPADLAKDLVAASGGTVTNMYGPTETTIWSSTQTVPGDGAAVPIGTPIANTQLYVLDRHRMPVPAGVAGELWIAGDGVVRGYHGRPELTAERFVPDPFAGEGARMYRTGDLVRWRDDGVLEFLGRTDHQVKIRGYRIELGEIESRLCDHHSVREGVVLAREDNPGDQRLVGYLTGADGVDDASLKAWMRATLPDFMVPSHLVRLDRFPLTPNGKIDRKALPAPDAVGKAAAAAPFVEPENALEGSIAAVWCETLGLEQVGVNDNFFDIGGHSLLVVRMHRSLREAITEPVSLTDLYRFPTVRTLAEFLASDGSSETVQKGVDRAARRRSMMQRRKRGRTG